MGEPPPALTGNLLLDALVDAELHYISSGPRSEHACSFDELDAFLRTSADELVGSHYYIPIGGSNRLGSLGYVRAAVEIAEQALAADLGPAHLVVAAGSGGTLAGLLAGLTLLGSEIRLLGIDIGRLWTDFPLHVSRVATAACELLGSPLGFDPDRVPLLEGRYVGTGYAEPSTAGCMAIRRLARSEGLLHLYRKLGINDAKHRTSLDYLRSLRGKKGISFAVGYDTLVAGPMGDLTHTQG
jgi:1-aminocyclopropane-1-carboxylate deaminase/D-cysteine desulfhydrase-like pyridoxal-dependent ACC family enzyme